METDMEPEVKLDPEALKNELAEDESPPEFEDQTSGASDALITGEEPAMHQFIYLLSLYQWKTLQL